MTGAPGTFGEPSTATSPGRQPSESVDGMYRNYHVGHGDPNANQRVAVDWNGGPLLVLAGPGAGKTEVLALRVVRLLEEDENASVLALTSTNQAADEMRDRVERRLGQDTDRALLSTFHAFATDILAQHGGHLGIRPDFQLLTRDEDRIAILEDVIRDLPSRDDRTAAGPDELAGSDRQALLGVIRRRGTVVVLDLHSPVVAAPLSPLLRCAGRREPPRLRQRAPLHEPALTGKASGRAGGATGVEARLRGRIPGHERGAIRPAPADRTRPPAHLFVVADDDPITYKWNGASPRRFDDLRRDYELETVHLPESYRCPPEIVERANRLIAHSRRLIETRRTVSLREQPVSYVGAVRTEVVDSAPQEAEFVGRDIRERGLATGECAVLGRTNRLVQLAAEGLRMAGLEAFVPQEERIRLPRSRCPGRGAETGQLAA